MKKYNTTKSSKRIKIETYLLAFFMPLVFCIAMLVLNDVYPFGDNCILHVDMYHQYEPFFTELATKLKTGGSLLYSWNLGMGSDFVALIAYYLASPFNLMLLVCPMNHIIEAMTIIIVLKMCLSGITFVAYASYKFKKVDYSYAFMALFYVFSGYMAAYYWDIMWLDGVMFVPLVLIGLEKLVWEDKPHMYTFLLGLAILCNFYIGYMICIFQVIWFLFQVIHIEERLHRIIVTIRFFVFSVLAGAFGAILMFPEAIILSYSGSEGFSFPKAFEMYFTVMSELARMSFRVEPYTAGDHWPNLYCGMAAIILMALYFLNKEIKKRDKIARALVILFFLFSFSINWLDFIWHGFHFPNSLPGRQVFLFVFMILMMGEEAFLKMKENRPRDFIFALLAGVVFVVIAYVWGDNAFVENSTVTLTAVILGAYVMLFFFLATCKKNERKVFLGLIAAIVLIETFSNFNATGFSTTSRVNYTSDWEPIKALVNFAKENDDGFYRMEKLERRTKNDAMIYGYKSSTIFSSMMNINIGSFYKIFGMEAGKNFYSDSGSTALSEALLSVKYLISDSENLESPLRTKVYESDGYYLYENKYVLPVGYCIPKYLESDWEHEPGEAFSNMNNLAKLLGASFNLFDEAEGEVVESDGVTTFTAEDEGYYYASYDDNGVTVINLITKNEKRKYTKADHGFLIDFGYLDSGDTVKVNFDQVDRLPVKVYKLNINVLDEVINILNTNTLYNISYTDTSLSGDVKIDDDSDLLLTVPYEAGWSLYVDGEKYEKSSFMDAFTLVELSAGEHHIEMRYFSPGLIVGAIITAIGFLLTLITLIIRIVVVKNNKL